MLPMCPTGIPTSIHRCPTWCARGASRKAFAPAATAQVLGARHAAAGADDSDGEAATDADIRTAAEYFGSMKLKPWIRVVESKTAPKTGNSRRHARAARRQERREQQRADRQSHVEVPVDGHLTEGLRDSQG